VVDSAPQDSRQSRSPLTLRSVLWAAAAVGATVIAAVLLLVWPFPLIPAVTPVERLDALRTSLAIGAGAAGAATLLLAGRRQVHLEETAAAADIDARERRITELYVKAVDQLGGNQAPVRLGGLHALERLAQDNPAHRQTVVNVLCSYLRMPFPLDEPARVGEGPSAGGPWVASFFGTPEQRQELEVRLSAQSILFRHLRAGSDSGHWDQSQYWPNMTVDLNSAVLVDFQFQQCRVASARFGGAVFVGRVRFYESVFDGYVEFDRAKFYSGAWFRRSEFHERAWFSGTEFCGEVNLAGARFRETAMFGGRIWFGGAKFRAHVEFDNVTFDAGIELDGATAIAGSGGNEFRRTWPPGWHLGTFVDENGWTSLQHEQS
jgi:hypothetical protein